MNVDDEGSETGDTDVVADLEQAHGPDDSDDEVVEVEPPATPVQKQKQGDGTSGSRTSRTPKEPALMESAPQVIAGRIRWC